MRIPILSGLMLTFMLPTASSARDIKMATEASFPPFSQTESDGTYTGFEVDLGNAVCAELEWNCTWVKQDFDGAIAALLANKFDVIFSSMSIKEERAKVADFSMPYYVTPTSFFGPDDGDLDPPNGLDGKVMGVYGGSTQQSYAEENYPDVELKQYENIDQMGADLTTGRIDLMFVEQLAGLTWTSSAAGTGYGMIGTTISAEEFGENGAGAMFRKGDSELRDAVDGALRTLYENGTFDEIAAKWLPDNTDIRADGLWAK